MMLLCPCRTWRERTRPWKTSTTLCRSPSALWRRSWGKPRRTTRSWCPAGWRRRLRRRTGSTLRTRRTAGSRTSHLQVSFLYCPIPLTDSVMMFQTQTSQTAEGAGRRCQRAAAHRPVSTVNFHFYSADVTREVLTHFSSQGRRHRGSGRGCWESRRRDFTSPPAQQNSQVRQHLSCFDRCTGGAHIKHNSPVILTYTCLHSYILTHVHTVCACRSTCVCIFNCQIKQDISMQIMMLRCAEKVYFYTIKCTKHFISCS